MNNEQTPEQTPINTKGGQAGHSQFSRLKIEVTAENIACAIPANSSHCMIADAVKSSLGKKMRLSKVLVDLQTIRFTDLKTKRRYICFTPRVGQRAIALFDQGIKPEPFSFKLKPAQIIEHIQKAKPATPTEPGKGASKPRIAIPSGRGAPVKIGGDALAITVGLRREFGIRQLGMPPSIPES